MVHIMFSTAAQSKLNKAPSICKASISPIIHRQHYKRVLLLLIGEPNRRADNLNRFKHEKEEKRHLAKSIIAYKMCSGVEWAP